MLATENDEQHGPLKRKRIKKTIMKSASNGLDFMGDFSVPEDRRLKAPKDSKIFYNWSTQTKQQPELLIG